MLLSSRRLLLLHHQCIPTTTSNSHMVAMMMTTRNSTTTRYSSTAAATPPPKPGTAAPPTATATATAAPPPPPPPPPPTPPPNPAAQAAALKRARLQDSLSVLPQFARLEIHQDKPSTVPKGMGGVLGGVPKAMLDRKVVVSKISANSMQSGSHASKAWGLSFEGKVPRWQNNLMEGYVSGGDPFDVTGLVTMRFDTKEDAVAFVERMGYQYTVEEPPFKKSFEGEKAYDKNFLNYHVQARLAKQSPSKTSRTQFAHPERGSQTWANLGELAVAKGTSIRDTSKTGAVDQTYWAAPSSQVSKQKPDSWRSDYFAKSAELARKLGK